MTLVTNVVRPISNADNEEGRRVLFTVSSQNLSLRIEEQLPVDGLLTYVPFFN